MNDAGHPATVRLWDLPTRLSHWALALLVTVGLITGEWQWPDIKIPLGGTIWQLPAMRLHVWCGLGILVVLMFRIAWGFVGSSTVRFSRFIRGPRAVIMYGRGLLRGAPSFVVGHNPLGALMVVALLLDLLFQAVTELFSRDPDDYLGIAVGPLNGSISEAWGQRLSHLHSVNHSVVEVLVALHIAANLFYWLVRREDLIAAMFTGRRKLPPGRSEVCVVLASNAKAIAVFALAIAGTWGAITLLRH